MIHCYINKDYEAEEDGIIDINIAFYIFIQINNIMVPTCEIRVITKTHVDMIEVHGRLSPNFIYDDNVKVYWNEEYEIINDRLEVWIKKNIGYIIDFLDGLSNDTEIDNIICLKSNKLK